MADAPESPSPDATTALYRAVVGDVRTEHYLAVFTRLDAAESIQLQWNWAASLFTFNWLVFRQLWRAALYYAGSVVAGFLVIFGIGRLVFQFSPATELALAGGFIGLLFAVPGLLGNALLHVDCRRRMTLALRSSNTEEEARLTLVGQASTRRRIGVLLVVNLVMLAFLGLATSQWMEFSASAGSLTPPTPTEPTTVAAAPLAPASLPAPLPTPPASVATAPIAQIDPIAPVTSAPRPVTGTAGRSAEGPVPWEAMKIAPPWAIAPNTPASAVRTPPAKLPSPAKPQAASAMQKLLLINVGLFAVEENARNTYDKLKRAGLPATLQPFSTSKGQRFRVRVGPYATRSEAAVAAEQVRSLSLEAQLIDAP